MNHITTQAMQVIRDAAGLRDAAIAIACHYMGFDLTGSEIDKDYFEAMQKRIAEETKQGELNL